MRGTLRTAYRRLRSLQWLSPGSFALCAITFAGVFLVIHLLGWRERTTVLCGTLPAGHRQQVIQGFEAILYTIFYLLTVVVSPILVMAALFFHLLVKLMEPRTAHAAEAHQT